MCVLLQYKISIPEHSANDFIYLDIVSLINVSKYNYIC